MVAWAGVAVGAIGSLGSLLLGYAAIVQNRKVKALKATADRHDEMLRGDA